MKTEQEIMDRIHEEVIRLGMEDGHMASLRLGRINALEWVLGLVE